MGLLLFKDLVAADADFSPLNLFGLNGKYDGRDHLLFEYSCGRAVDETVARVRWLCRSAAGR